MIRSVEQKKRGVWVGREGMQGIPKTVAYNQIGAIGFLFFTVSGEEKGIKLITTKIIIKIYAYREHR